MVAFRVAIYGSTFDLYSLFRGTGVDPARIDLERELDLERGVARYTVRRETDPRKLLEGRTR